MGSVAATGGDACRFDCLFLGVAGLLVVIGFLYRLSSALLLLTWGYLYVVEATRTYWRSDYYLDLLLLM